MSRSFSSPRARTIASLGVLMAATAIVGFAVLGSGVLEVRAEPLDLGVPHQLQAKGDRLVVVVKGTACSALGWPHYEQSCQFDMRRAAGDVRTVRIIALR
jgi:hypothetical protein